VAFHGNPSSAPSNENALLVSSRARRLNARRDRQAGGHWFEPSTAHHEKVPHTGPFSLSACRKWASEVLLARTRATNRNTVFPLLPARTVPTGLAGGLGLAPPIGRRNTNRIADVPVHRTTVPCSTTRRSSSVSTATWRIGLFYSWIPTRSCLAPSDPRCVAVGATATVPCTRRGCDSGRDSPAPLR
jgi:hypothetical protein